MATAIRNRSVPEEPVPSARPVRPGGVAARAGWFVVASMPVAAALFVALAGIAPAWTPLFAVLAGLVVGIALVRQTARLGASHEAYETLATNLELDPESRLAGPRVFAAEFSDALAASERLSAPVSVVMVSIDDLRPLILERGVDSAARVWRQVGASLASAAAIEGGRAYRVHAHALAAVLPGVSLAKAERVVARLQPALALAERRHSGLAKVSTGAAVAVRGDLPDDVLLRAEQQCARSRSGVSTPNVPRLRAVPPPA